MFLVAHCTVLGSSGHFWFFQVMITYLPDQDSKTTMLLGLSALMDILSDAINGFKLHPLKESSTLEHQLVESSAHILLMNVPLVLEHGGVESEIVWHLTKLEKKFIKKGILPAEYHVVLLLEIKVLQRQSKQGKGKSKA
jgi:hypothetical protein